MSIKFSQLREQLRPKTGNALAMFFLSILLLLFLPNISNKFYHGTGEDQIYTKQKLRTGEYFLGERHVSLWISSGLKQGIPW